MAFTPTWLDGFDAYATGAGPAADLSLWYTVAVGPDITAPGALGTGKYLAPTASGDRIGRAMTATAVPAGGLRVKALADGTDFLEFFNGSTTHVRLRCANTSGVLQVHGAGVLVASGPALVPGRWYWIDYELPIGDSVTVKVWIDGALVINAAGVDTRNGATTTVDNWRLSGATGLWGFDDFILGTGTGPVGDHNVEFVLPDGAGAFAEWASNGAATNWQCIDEPGASDGDTTYVSSATAGQRVRTTAGDLVSTAGTITAIQLEAIARKDDAGVRTLALVSRLAGTDKVGATQGLGASYGGFSELQTVDPAGAAWTIANVNAAEIGVNEIA
jgi:hypothetical protein